MPKVKDLEREYSMVHLYLDPESEMERQDFRQLCVDAKGVPVHFEEREKWLADNGYEVTRENLVKKNLAPQADDGQAVS